MRPLNSVAVRVRGPSLGLNTSDAPDTLDNRAWTVARNVRFEGKAVRNATGYQDVVLQVDGQPATLAFDLLHQGDLISEFEPTPFFGCAGANIYRVVRSTADGDYVADAVALYEGLPVNREFPWSVADFYDSVVFAQRDNPVRVWSATNNGETLPLAGLAENDDKWEGVGSLHGHLLLWRDDRLKWSAQNDKALFLPVATTASSVVLTVTASFVQPEDAATTVEISCAENPQDAGLVPGQFLRLDDVREGGVVFPCYYSVVSAGATSVTVRRMMLTGATPGGEMVSAGQRLLTVDANEAGETRVVGAGVNGPIWRIVEQGDGAVIFKEHAILTLQYVGRASGTFFIRPEVRGEGLLARTGVLSLPDGRTLFLGHEHIYVYAGGAALTPVCEQVREQVYGEIDRTRLDLVRMFLHEQTQEVWVVYPVTGGFRVLVWNYLDDAVSFDDYAAGDEGILSIAMVNWESDPAWSSFAESVTWDGFLPDLTWEDLATGEYDRCVVASLASGRLVMLRDVFARNGAAYVSLAETKDFDFDAPDAWKYVQTVAVHAHVRSPEANERRLYVQVGGRASLDQDIVWSAPFPVQVQGNAPPPCKVNPGGAGRFIRLRFYSEDVGVEWRLSGFDIYARMGGAY